MAFSGATDDRLALRELLDTYADAVVQRDPAQWGETWAQDAEWEMIGVPGFPNPKGRETIVKIWQGAIANFPGINFIAIPGTLKVNGDKATGRSYVAEIFTDADNITHHARGQYDDEFVKLDGQWFFQKRVYQILHTSSSASAKKKDQNS